MQVTNGGDKEVQLKKVLALHEDIIKAGAARMSWCTEGHASASPGAGSGVEIATRPRTPLPSKRSAAAGQPRAATLKLAGRGGSGSITVHKV